MSKMAINFNLADTSKNDALEPVEFRKAISDLLGNYDSNGDGYITKSQDAKKNEMTEDFWSSASFFGSQKSELPKEIDLYYKGRVTAHPFGLVADSWMSDNDFVTLAWEDAGGNVDREIYGGDKVAFPVYNLTGSVTRDQIKQKKNAWVVEA